MAKRLDQQFSADERKAWEAGTTKEWADESLAITNENWNGNWDQRTVLTGERLVGKIEARRLRIRPALDDPLFSTRRML